jgi:HemY protein
VLDKKALRALLEERWHDCEIYFYKSAKKNAYPFFHYVAAAQAAFEQKKEDTANRYLNKAQKIAQPSESLVLDIMRARWQLSSGNYQQALDTLLLLQKVSPTHPFVLSGLKDVYLKANHWQTLSELLPQLRKHTTLDPAQLDELELRVLPALLEQAGQSKQLEEAWRNTSKKWHENPQLLSVYTKYLIADNQHPKAEALLKVALKKYRDESLLEQYANINSKDPVKHLARAESWLKQDEQNPALLFCLGKLCASHRLWGKAKTYLEASLKYQPRVQIYPVLGEVLEQLDEKHAALECYKKGFDLYEKNATK